MQLHVSVPLATTVPFLFLRKEGLSKCGRCKQAFYCDVQCQVGLGQLVGRALFPLKIGTPMSFLSLSRHSQHPFAARAGKLFGPHMCLDTPACWPRTDRQPVIDSDTLRPHAGAGEGESHEEGMLGTGRCITKVDGLPPRPPATDGTLWR